MSEAPGGITRLINSLGFFREPQKKSLTSADASVMQIFFQTRYKTRARNSSVNQSDASEKSTKKKKRFRGSPRRRVRRVGGVSFVTAILTGFILPYYDVYVTHDIRVALLHKRRRFAALLVSPAKKSEGAWRTPDASNRHPRKRQPLHHFRYKIDTRD